MKDRYFEFIPLIKRKEEKNDLMFIFEKGSLLLKKINDTLSIPLRSDINDEVLNNSMIHCMGEFNKIGCYAVEGVNIDNISNDFELVDLYESGVILSEDMFSLAGRGRQIIHFNQQSKFCGKCGSKTIDKKDERAKICTSCGNLIFPSICPAIIVAITKGDELLLAHNKNFKNNMYSIIAGFVDQGETLEECVKREVFEEVGIGVKNIRYYNSQPWAFPNSLMVGFIAEYESGEIKVDGKEIVHAGWFKEGNYPTLPRKMSIAGKMIEAFRKGSLT